MPHASTVADLGGTQGTRPPPPGGQILSISCSFLGKYGKIVCWRSPPVSWRPLLIGEILDPPLFNAVDSLNGVVYLDQEDEALVALRMLTVFMTSLRICVCINMCVIP